MSVAMLNGWPKTIWLQRDEANENYSDYPADITWCVDKINHNDVEYVMSEIQAEREKALVKHVLNKADYISFKDYPVSS